MTETQEIKAKSMELALLFMGLILELPITDTENEDEVAEFEDAFNKAVHFSRKFEAFIMSDLLVPPKL